MISNHVILFAVCKITNNPAKHIMNYVAPIIDNGDYDNYLKLNFHNRVISVKLRENGAVDFVDEFNLLYTVTQQVSMLNHLQCQVIDGQVHFAGNLGCVRYEDVDNVKDFYIANRYIYILKLDGSLICRGIDIIDYFKEVDLGVDVDNLKFEKLH